MNALDKSVSSDLIRQGRRLQWFTIAWNSLEGMVSIAAGAIAGSVSLLGFGLDSMIEVISGAAALWRVQAESDPSRRERVERASLRVIGFCFVSLAAFLLIDSTLSLWHKHSPERSPVGIAITTLSLCVMPIPARAKRTVATGMQSEAVSADARQTDFCAYLSAIALAGLVANWLLGWWWADPVAALMMVPIIGHEAVQALGNWDCSCKPST
ncbi:MAG: cation transporter [Acidobacteriaceae bacterium]